MQNVIESYLVSLGFTVSEPELRKFQLGMKDAASTVEHYTSGIGRDLLKWQAGITTAFTGISGAIVGLGDHIASQDQRFRLLGMRMFTTTENARKLQMTMDALGQPLENLIWDKELHARAMAIGADIDRMSKQLGPNFEANMQRLRDFTMQFDRLKLSAEFLQMQFVNTLFAKFGPDVDKAYNELKRFVDWCEASLPHIADELAKTAVPILKDTWYILKSLRDEGKQVGLVFTNIVGALSGDSSIEGASFSFDKLATAIQHVTHWMSTFVQYVTLAEKMLLHFVDGAVLALSGRMGDAAAEMRAAISDMNAATLGLTGVLGGVGMGGAIGGLSAMIAGAPAGPLGMLFTGAIGAGGGAITGGIDMVLLGLGIGKLKEKFAPADPTKGDLALVTKASGLDTGGKYAARPALGVDAWAEDRLPKWFTQRWTPFFNGTFEPWIARRLGMHAQSTVASSSAISTPSSDFLDNQV